MCVYTHIFFILSSVDGHLGYSHTLAMVNNAALKIGVHVSFRMILFVFFLFFGDISQEVKLLGHTVVRVFGFYLFFKKETLLFRVFLKVVVD